MSDSAGLVSLMGLGVAGYWLWLCELDLKIEWLLNKFQKAIDE